MILEKLQTLIADQLGVDGNSITMDTNFEEDLGVDSLDIVELSMALEEEFDIGEMSEEDLATIKTVGTWSTIYRVNWTFNRPKRACGPRMDGAVCGRRKTTMQPLEEKNSAIPSRTNACWRTPSPTVPMPTSTGEVTPTATSGWNFWETPSWAWWWRTIFTAPVQTCRRGT